MDSVRSCTKSAGTQEKSFSFSHLGGFFGLNLIIIALFSALFAFFSFLFIMSVRVDFVVMIRNTLLSILGVLAYLFIGISHSYFFQQPSVRSAIVGAYHLSIEKMGRVLLFVATTALASIALWVSYLGIDWLLIHLFGQLSGTIGAFTAYQITTGVIAFILAMLLLAFNNIYFFCIVKKDIHATR